MSIFIGADFIATPTNYDLFSSGDAETLFGSELKVLLDSGKYRIFNLELPLTDGDTPLQKNGPCLKAPVTTVNGYTAVNVDLFTVANNHIMDQGREGLASTIAVLDSKGIAHVGAGDSIKDAEKPHIFEYEGKKIGVYACVEHEFSVITESSSGANPYDPLVSFDRVSELKASCDRVIVLYHGGKEYYRYPSPDLQKVCRRFIDKGADLVVCQHSHCIGCEEAYNGGTIVYGQGNFLFDKSEHECWQTALLIKLEGEFKPTYIPVVREKNKVRLASSETAEEILDGFKKRSEEIKQDGFVDRKYSEFAESRFYSYMSCFSGSVQRNVFYRVIDKLSGGKLSRASYDRRYGVKALLGLKNFIECEAHRELIIRVIDSRLQSINRAKKK